MLDRFPKSFGHSTAEKRKNMRRFFEDIAKDKNMDPLVPENWYEFTQSAFRKIQV